MRCIAAALALCGCNQIYGLDQTRGRDAAPDRQVRISMLVGGTNDMANEAPVVLATVTPDPKPRIALLADDFANAPYVADSISGVVPYPNGFVGKPWRLEYEDGVPHEVQWSPADGQGHLIVPIAGRASRTQVPANTGYTLSMMLPSTALYNFSASTVIYTSGYWSATPIGAATQTPTVDFSAAPSMSGPPGAPSPAAKDFVFAIDYTQQSGCRVAKAAGTAEALDLEPGALKQLALVLESSTEQPELVYEGELPLATGSRLSEALADRGGAQLTGSIYGRFAHSALPAFTTSIGDVPAPLIIPLAECPITQQPPSVFDVGGRLMFAKGMFAYLANDRVVNGTRLRSSIAAVGRVKSGSVNTYQATFAVPCARDIAVGGEPLVDGKVIAAPVDVTFALDPDTSLVVDYFEVLLYRFAGTSLELVRTYVGPDPSKRTIRFDPMVMLPGQDYVFAIRTYRGRPNARNADFQPVQAPQAVATIFTHTFKR